MAGKGTVTIKYLGDVKDLQRSMGRAKQATGGFTGSLKKAALALGGLYVAKQAARWLIDCAKAADADRISQATLAKVLQNTTGATDDQIKSMEKWIRTQQFGLGISDELIRQGLSPILAVTKDATKAQELMADAMDLSVGRNMDLKAASELLAKGFSGNMGLFSRYGISIKRADGSTKSFSEVLDDLRVSYGGAAKAAADASPWGQLGEIWEEFKETLGAELLPLFQDLAQWFVDNPGVIEDAAKKIAGAIKTIRDAFHFATEKINLFISAMASAFGYNPEIDAINADTNLHNVNSQTIQQNLTDLGRSGQSAGRSHGYSPESNLIRIPERAMGGPIFGSPGQAVPIIAHGGEYVLTQKDASNLSSIMASVASEVKALRSEVRMQNQRFTTLARTGALVKAGAM